ncbi:MAG: antitoxin [Acidobacteriota bacterium]
MRTTLDLDAPVLKHLKSLQEETGKSLGQLASELLAEALARRAARPPSGPTFRWTTKAMGAVFDIEDKERLYEALESDDSVHEGPAV